MTVSEEVRTKITELRNSGQSIRSIATALNIGKSTVSSILKTKTPDVINQDILSHVPVVEESMSISNDETTSFLQAIEPPPVSAPPDLDKKAFLREFAKTLRSPNPPEEVEAPVKVSKKRTPKTVKAQSPEPEAVKVEEPDKGTLISKITTLVETFAPILTTHVKDPAKFIESLPGRSVSDLMITLQTLETTKTMHNGANGMRFLFGMVAGAVEALGPKAGLKTSGYQQAVMSQEHELRLIFKELAYNNLDSIKRVQGPEVRLAMIMTQTLLAIDSKNRSTQTLSSSVPPESQERFNDL